MRRMIIFSILALICSNIWAGFPTEDFNDASAWVGYTPTWPSNDMTFSGNVWNFINVAEYLSGTDYELEITHSPYGKITSHYFENGVGTISFQAAKTTSNNTEIAVQFSVDGGSFSNILYNYSYYVTITSSTPTTYNIPVNRPDAHYIRIQARYYGVRIDDISVSNEISIIEPTVTVAAISNITKFAASGGGNVTDDGGAPVLARGVCWDTNQGPTLASGNFTVDGTGSGTFTSSITGLDANTHYYVRSYATNSAGTAYSEYNFPAEFTTVNYVAPTAVTDGASDVNHVFAHLNGTVNGDEASTTVGFEYGETDSYGSEAIADESPLSGADDQSVQAPLNGLNEYTTYHFRVKATNVIGTTYGEDKTFTTTNNPNQTSTQSIPAATPDPDPIEFTDTGVTVDFSGVSGATGLDDITVGQFNVPPENLSGLIGSEISVSGNSYLFTNHTGFTFTSTIQFLVSDISGLDLDLFETLEDGAETTIKLWKRPEYGSGDFIDQGFLLYDDGLDNINNTADDFLYMIGVSSFSEVTFTSEGDHPLPVVLSSFFAMYSNDVLKINWTTEYEENNLGWNIYRGMFDNAMQNGATIRVNSQVIEGAGTTVTSTNYEFIDEQNILNGENYWYWLEAISTDGETEILGPTTISIPLGNAPQVPEIYGLRQNYPNPFNPSTSISFVLKKAGNCQVDVLDVKGSKVMTIFAGEVIADLVYNIDWNGDDEEGKKVSSGIYFYKLISGDFSETKKMLLLK